MSSLMRQISAHITKAETEKYRIARREGYFELTDDPRPPGTYPKDEFQAEIKAATEAGKARPLSWYWRIVTDRHGKKGRLVTRKSVGCPDMGRAAQYYVLGEQRVSVPEAECKRCKYYISTKKNQKSFSECGLEKVLAKEVK